MGAFIQEIFGSEKYIGIFRDIFQNAHYYFIANRMIAKAGKMTREEIAQYQYGRLKKIIEFAYEYIPFYREHFRAAGFRPEHFRKTEDIRHIPYLTKNMIRESYREMFPANAPLKNLKLVTTGGSTGAPLEFYLDRRTSTPVEFAYIQWIWKQFGYHFRDRCVILRGDTVSESQDSGSFWKMNYPMNWLIMSSLRLNESTFPAYLKKIREFKPRFIVAYPSIAFILARYLRTHTITPIESLKGIICSSETLYEWQQKCISESFNARVFAYYGLTEKCCIAHKLPDSNRYAFMPTYGFVEVINKSDQWCSEEGESGEIIATGLNSLTTPLIRYKTQDVCVYSGESSGNHFGWPIVKGMTGRISEFLIDKSGNMVTFTRSDELFWTILHKLNAYQFVQDIPGKIQLKLDLKQALTEEEHKKILQTFFQYYPNFEVELIFSESIPRTQSGKFRYLIQNLPYDCQPNA